MTFVSFSKERYLLFCFMLTGLSWQSSGWEQAFKKQTWLVVIPWICFKFLRYNKHNRGVFEKLSDCQRTLDTKSRNLLHFTATATLLIEEKTWLLCFLKTPSNVAHNQVVEGLCSACSEPFLKSQIVPTSLVLTETGCTCLITHLSWPLKVEVLATALLPATSSSNKLPFLFQWCRAWALNHQREWEESPLWSFLYDTSSEGVLFITI